MSKRIEWVDIAKGICIVFVVMMHSTLGVESVAGETGWMHNLVAFAKPFRMPDFFMISGLFLMQVMNRPWRFYLDRKVVHFFYFYLLWLTIQFVFKAPSIMSDGGSSAVISAYLMAFIEPFGTLWFIYILPVFFIVTRLLRKVPVVLMLILLALLEILPIHTGWIMIDEFCSRFIYFYAGYALAPHIFRFAEWVEAHNKVALVLLGAWVAIEYYLVFTPVTPQFQPLLGQLAFSSGGLGGYSELPVISLMLGVAGALAIIAASALLARLDVSHIVHQAISWLGAHSIVIYLAFFLPMAITRTILLKFMPDLGVGNIALLTTCAAVIGPVILYFLIDKSGYGRFLFTRPDWAKIYHQDKLRQPAVAG